MVGLFVLRVVSWLKEVVGELVGCVCGWMGDDRGRIVTT